MDKYVRHATTGVWKAQTDPWPLSTHPKRLEYKTSTLHGGMWVWYLHELQVSEPLRSKHGCQSHCCCLFAPKAVSQLRVQQKNSSSKKQKKTGEQTLLCYVTAFVARLTHRSVLLQTVAALFPLRGTIHRTGRDTRAPFAGVRATDRRMREKQKKPTSSHRRATLCHLQSRCLSGFLMAIVTDAAASRTWAGPHAARHTSSVLKRGQTSADAPLWRERESSILFIYVFFGGEGGWVLFHKRSTEECVEFHTEVQHGTLRGFDL